MKKINILTLLIFSASLFSCGNTTKKENDEVEVVEVDTQKKEIYEAAASDIEFNNLTVAAVYSEYINLKTALVNSDVTETSNAAMELMTAFANMGVSDEAMTSAQIIVEAMDIEEQRTEFSPITEIVESILDGAITSGVIYKQYCPMAFDFTGGFWLSNSKEINNPYFGDKMLRCGKVDSEIK